jgi:hypothetical protein
VILDLGADLFEVHKAHNSPRMGAWGHLMPLADLEQLIRTPEATRWQAPGLRTTERTTERMLSKVDLDYILAHLPEQGYYQSEEGK